MTVQLKGCIKNSNKKYTDSLTFFSFSLLATGRKIQRKGYKVTAYNKKETLSFNEHKLQLSENKVRKEEKIHSNHDEEGEERNVDEGDGEEETKEEESNEMEGYKDAKKAKNDSKVEGEGNESGDIQKNVVHWTRSSP